MSFLPNIFSGSNAITTEDIDSYISNISQNIDIQSNILELQEASSQYSNYICKNALPALFNALIQSKMNDDIIADIFQILNNCITDSEYSSSNALLIVDYDLSLPVIIDCIDTEKAKKKIAVIQIITKLGILQPSQLQQHLINEQDRLVHFLTLIDDPNPEVVHDFLALLPILVLNNSDFQQLFSFNIMEKLMKLIENKTPLAISSLRALLSSNTTTQNLFFGTVENMSIVASLLENEDADTLSLFIEIFSSQNSSNYRHFLKEANIIQIILDKSLSDNQQFIRLLGLSIKKEPDFCKLIRENDNLSKFLNTYLQSNDEIADMYYLALFKSFLYQSDESCYSLSELIITIDDRNEPKLIKLATLTMMSGPDSKIVFLSNSPNFTSSMIGFFISHINFEFVLHFLIVLCWESKNSCLEFKNEPSEPISFLRQFLPNESPLIHAQCCLLLRIIHYVLDQKEEQQQQEEIKKDDEKDDIEQLDIQIRDLSTYLSTLEANDYYDFIRQIISIILNEPITPRIKEAEISKEVDEISENEKSSNAKEETVIEEEEEEVESFENKSTNSDNNNNNNNKDVDENEDAIANYDQIILEMKNKSIEDQIKLENELRKAKDEISKLKSQLISTGANASADSELIQRQFDEFREQQNEEIARINSKNLEEKEIIERNYKNEIESLQSQILSLQSNLDSVTASSEKEIAELKQKIVSTEIECTQKVSQMKNMNRVSISKQIEDLRDQCESMKRDLGILRSQHKALFAQQIAEFKDEQAEFQKIVEENKSLKFRISQLLKENEHFKYENQQLNEDKTNFVQSPDSFEKSPARSIKVNKLNQTGNVTADQLIVSLNAQINDLQSQNHSLLQKDSENQREIANLKRENSNAQEIRQSWDGYMNQLNQLKSENDSIKNQLSQANNSKNELQKIIDNNQAKIDDLSSRYSEAQKVATSVKALVDLNCKLQNDLEKANSQNVQMEVDLNLLKSRSSNKQLVDLMNQNSELKKSVFDADQIRAQNSELQKTSNALKKDNSAFRSQILDFERKVARLETENNFLKEQATSFTSQGQISDINSNDTSNQNSHHLLLKDLNSKIVGLNEQLSAIQGTDINSKLEKENNELKQQVLQTTVKISTLQDENSHLKKLLKSEQQESEKLRRSAEFANSDLSLDIDDTIESLTQNSAELTKKITEKDKEISILKIDLKDAQEQLRKQLRNDNESREKEMATLRGFLTSNTSKFKILSEIKNRIDKESSRVAQLIIATRQHKMILKERDFDLENNDEIEQLKVDNNLLKETVNDLNKRIERLTRDNTKLAKHASHLTSKFRELSKENTFLKNNSVLSSSENVIENENDKKSKSQNGNNLADEKDVIALQKQIEFAKSERERQEEHILSLINQNKALIAQVAELNSSFSDNSAHNEIIQLREEAEALHSESSSLKEKCRILENEKFIAMQQKAATIEQLRTAMSDLRSLQETFLDLQEKYGKIKKKHLKLKMKMDNKELMSIKRQKKLTFGMFGRNRDLSYDFGMNNIHNSYFNSMNSPIRNDAQSFFYQPPGRPEFWPTSSESNNIPTTDTESATISPSHSDSELNLAASPVTPHLFPHPRVHYQSLENMKRMNHSDSTNSLSRRSSSDQNLNESYLLRTLADTDDNEKVDLTKPNGDNSIIKSSDENVDGNEGAESFDVESEIEPFSHFSPQEFLEGSNLGENDNDNSNLAGVDNVKDLNENDLDINDFNNSGIQNKSLFAEGNEPPLYSDHDPLMQYIGSMSLLNNSDVANDLNNSAVDDAGIERVNGANNSMNQDFDMDLDLDNVNPNQSIDLNDGENDDLGLLDDVNNNDFNNAFGNDDFGDENGDDDAANEMSQKKALRVIGQLWLKNQNK